MVNFLCALALQASVLGDLKAERSGESMWSTPLGIVIGIVFLYFLIKGMSGKGD